MISRHRLSIFNKFVYIVFFLFNFNDNNNQKSTMMRWKETHAQKYVSISFRNSMYLCELKYRCACACVCVIARVRACVCCSDVSMCVCMCFYCYGCCCCCCCILQDCIETQSYGMLNTNFFLCQLLLVGLMIW